MFVTNPFAAIDLVSPAFMQGWLVLMVLLVIAGTLADVIHKKSAKYFFQLEEEQKKLAKRQVSSGERMGLLVKTISSEVLTSSEFCNPKRRLSHLLTMYGFIVMTVATAVLIFGYPDASEPAPAIWSLLWHLGALSLAVGALWFWFGIRVDLVSEGNDVIDFKQRDIFVIGLIATSVFGLLWSLVQSAGPGVWSNIFFVLFLVSATFLFSTILWSKFAHMFFKPAAAYQKKIAWADGSREKLPDIPDLSSPETHRRFPDIPTYMGKNPPYMGLGIKREPPNHY